MRVEQALRFGKNWRDFSKSAALCGFTGRSPRRGFRASAACVSLVHLPTVIGGPQLLAQGSFQFRGIALDPPPEGDVLDRKSALGKKFLHVTVGQTKSASTDRRPVGSFPVNV